jgi:hypothetical protein
LLHAASDVLLAFNMTATIANQGDRAQPKQSDICLPLNLPKMANGGFLHVLIEETQYLIEKAPAEVWEDMQPGVELLGLNMVKAAVKRQ